MKRILSLLLMLVLLPSAVLAEGPAMDKATWLSPYQYYYPQLPETHKAAWEHDVANTLSYPEYVAAEYDARYRALAKMIYMDNPRLFWVDWIDDYGRLQYLVKNPELFNQPMQIENGLTLADLQKNFLEAIPQAVAAIEKKLPKKANATKIVTAIHDWLCENNTYNNEQVSTNKGAKDPVAFGFLASHSAYSAIIPGDEYEPVCEGYALAFKLLCDEFGIESICVSGTLNGVRHMWNLVNLGEGKWYLTDVTNDDRYDGKPYFLLLNSKKAAKNDFIPDPYLGSGVKPENGYAAEEGAQFLFPEIAAK